MNQFSPITGAAGVVARSLDTRVNTLETTGVPAVDVDAIAEIVVESAPVADGLALAKAGKFQTRTEVAAVNIPAEIGVIDVQRYSPAHSVAPARYYRDTAPSTGAFQSGDGVWWRLAEPIVRLEMLGAVGDGAPDDQAAWSLARTIGRPVYLSGKYLATDTGNTLGVPLIGPGKLIKAVDGGFAQANSDRDRGPVYFREHLWKVKNRQISAEKLKAVLVGDSTVTDGYGINIGKLVTGEFRNMGVAVAEVLNNAVAGHSWGSQNLANLLTGLADQKHLLIAKFGINDASTGDMSAALIALRNSMRQRLSEIRESIYGGYDNLSILIIMPNALGNTATNANNRNNLWLESILGIYIEAAKDFQCALYDPYQESRNAEGGENRWLDNILVHPQVNYNLDIWGRALGETLKPHGSISRNVFHNLAYDEGTAPPATGGLSLYPMGLSHLRVVSGDGWPFGGSLVITFRNPDNCGWQIIYAYNQPHTQTRQRTWATASNAWTKWTGDSVELTLQNSWVAYGGTLGVPSARRSADGWIGLSGVMKSGTVAATTLLFTLPAGYRPASEMYINAVRYVGSSPENTLLRIQTNGQVTIIRNADALYLGLDGISFGAAL